MTTPDDATAGDGEECAQPDEPQDANGTGVADAVEEPTAKRPRLEGQPFVDEAQIDDFADAQSSDDDWGLDFGEPGVQVDVRDEDVADNIQSWPGMEFPQEVDERPSTKKASRQDDDLVGAAAPGSPGGLGGVQVVPQVIAQDEDVLDDNDEEFGDVGWREDPREKRKDEERHDINYAEEEVTLDESWTLWPANSPEAIVATALVQKIRSRVQHVKAVEGGFPSEAAANIFNRTMTTKKENDQYTLIAALLWVESKVLEGTSVPADINDSTIKLLSSQEQALKHVTKLVSHSKIRTRASCELPRLETRKAAKDQIVPGLAQRLYNEVQKNTRTLNQADIDALIADVLAEEPLTVQIVALLHVIQYAHLDPTRFADQESLNASFAKQLLPERKMEIVCRIGLEEACKLAESLEENETTRELREHKLKTLRRLWNSWGVRPTEEQLASIHILPLERQLSVLLNVERDIELLWSKEAPKRSEREKWKEFSKHLAKFDELASPYAFPENAMQPKTGRTTKLQAESGVQLTIIEVAKARENVTSLLKRMKLHYGWSPRNRTVKLMLSVNWVGRLSALVNLANRTQILQADDEFVQLLLDEQRRIIGSEVLGQFENWHKLEFKPAKVLSKDESLARQREYDEYMADDRKRLGPQGTYMPRTPAPLGMPPTPAPAFFGGSRTPAGLPPPGTPALPGQRYPGGTPAGPPPATPAFNVLHSRTPAGAPPPTPGMPAMFSGADADEPGTPVVAVAGAGSGTLPGTPSVGRMVPKTPVGASPMTPAAAFNVNVGSSIPSTPGAAPSTPHAAAPMTPGVFGAGNRFPGTPAGPPPATPALFPRGAPHTPAGPPPATPAPQAYPPGTPAGPPPPTPAGCGFGSRPPATPAGPPPATPAGPPPATPAGPPPATPAGPPPATPAGPPPATPAGIRS
eukprot:TRINITY_DN6944_c0_g1_i1.p1 TRINITY_DN6944_c0_g1~~TRINITY_DN6944_c0_g1_i1.p1  ORF type:complete len:921 (-),score=166.56 TRINITY_DN6944_c0_g1_i1:78-2840(-)